jgi:hypothetical protein
MAASRGRGRPTGPSDLWSCPSCGRPFANANQSHACAVQSAQALEALISGKGEQVRALFEAFREAVEEHGPALVIASKTRIGFQVRMIFAALMPRAGYLRGHLILAERTEDPRFLRVTTLSPRNHVHEFELRSAAQLDAAFRALIGRAYRVGRQEHLGRARRSE